jgi:carbon-monoxide dehydrogenase medium subunit
MIPAPFDYAAPDSIQAAVDLLKRAGDDAKVITGGHSLIPLMRLRLAQPRLLVDLRKIPELTRITTEGNVLHVGGAATHDALARSVDVRRSHPVIADCAASIGDLQVRNVGTVGGSLIHGDPAADWPAALLATEATFTLQGPDGKRQVPAQDFFLGMMETAARDGEILTAITVPPAPAGTGSVYQKIAQSASGFALCGVAAVVAWDGAKVTTTRVGITGVADKAFRARTAELALTGTRGTLEDIEAAAEHGADGVQALEDIHASSEFRLHLARVLTRRTLIRALELARKSGS